MITSEKTRQFADLIDRTLAERQVPPDTRNWGERLSRRLRTPVQVMVMGLPDSGKSSVVNMLAGRPAIPRLSDLPVIELTAGDVEEVEIETENGETHRLPGLLEQVDLPAGIVRVRQALPDTALRHLNFVEVSLTGSEALQEAVLEWAVERADIVLWCTQAFGAAEQGHWAKVPDPLKDRSFLVLTKADQMLMKGTLPDRIAALEDVVAEEFMSLYPVATIQAIAAQAGGDQGQANLWKSSGGKALKDEVMRQVANGISADIDNARVFLMRQGQDQALAELDAAAPVPVPVTPHGTGSPVPAAPAPATIRVLHPDRAGHDQIQPDRRQTRLLDAALKSLQVHADTMFAGMSGGGGADSRQVLDRCVSAVNEITDMMNEACEGNPGLAELHEDAMDSSEMMVLFRLEDTEDAAADAVTLLMQLKKEIAERAAG